MRILPRASAAQVRNRPTLGGELLPGNQAPSPAPSSTSTKYRFRLMAESSIAGHGQGSRSRMALVYAVDWALFDA